MFGEPSANELIEGYLRNGHKIINTPRRIIVSISPKQAQYIHKISTPKNNWCIYNDNVYSWHIQKGKGNANYIVAIFRYTLEDYQTGEVSRKIEDTPPSKPKFTKPNPQQELNLFDEI